MFMSKHGQNLKVTPRACHLLNLYVKKHNEAAFSELFGLIGRHVRTNLTRDDVSFCEMVRLLSTESQPLTMENSTLLARYVDSGLVNNDAFVAHVAASNDEDVADAIRAAYWSARMTSGVQLVRPHEYQVILYLDDDGSDDGIVPFLEELAPSESNRLMDIIQQSTQVKTAREQKQVLEITLGTILEEWIQSYRRRPARACEIQDDGSVVVLERYALRHDRAGLPQLLKALACEIDKTRVCRVTHEFIQDIVEDIEDIE